MPRKGNQIQTKGKVKPLKKAVKPTSKSANVDGLGKAEPTESEIDELFGNIIKADIRRNGIKTVSRFKIMKALGR